MGIFEQKRPARNLRLKIKMTPSWKKLQMRFMEKSSTVEFSKIIANSLPAKKYLKLKME